MTNGVASSYACANCCPDSFFDGWVSPGQVSCVVSDETQFCAVRQDRTCFGLVSELFRVSG